MTGFHPVQQQYAIREMPPEPISILLVDDHAIVRRRYRELLERERSFVVVGEAGEAEEVYQLFQALAPTVVVMDLSLPDANGIDTTRRLLNHNPDARVVILTMHEQTIFALHSMRSGAYGFVTKRTAPETLVRAVRAAAEGKKYLSPDIGRQLSLD
jgi:two-component system, NarL family, invasion response regulator UvrY